MNKLGHIVTFSVNSIRLSGDIMFLSGMTCCKTMFKSIMFHDITFNGIYTLRTFMINDVLRVITLGGFCDSIMLVAFNSHTLCKERRASTM